MLSLEETELRQSLSHFGEGKQSSNRQQKYAQSTVGWRRISNQPGAGGCLSEGANQKRELMLGLKNQENESAGNKRRTTQAIKKSLYKGARTDKVCSIR